MWLKLDNQFRKIKVDGKEVKELGYPSYFKNIPPEKLPKEGETVKAWLPSLSQSINPFWVIVLTPLIVALFTWLRRKGKEPSTPTKIAFGLLISALSVLVMIAAVKAGNNGGRKSKCMVADRQLWRYYNWRIIFKPDGIITGFQT